jgi:ATP-binding cassette, subfamily B, bacterial MsbA
MFSSFFLTLDWTARLMRRVSMSRKRLVAAVSLLLVGGGLEGATVGLLVPLLSMLTGTNSPTRGYVQMVIDTVFGSFSPNSRVILLGLAIVGLVAAKNLLTYAGVAMAGTLRAEASVELRRQLLERVLHAAPATLESHTSGEVTKVFVSDAWRVSRILELCVALLHRSIVAVSYVVAISFLSWELTLVTLVFGLFLAVASQRLGRRGLRFGRALTQKNGEVARHVTEIVGGLRIVRTTSSEQEWERSFAGASNGYAKAELGAANSQALMIGVVETLGITGAMGLTALAHSLLLAPGALDVPAFLAFGFGLIRLLPALNQVYSAQAYLVPLVGSVEVLLHWLELPDYPTRPFGRAKVPRLTHGIRFENVTFAYPNRDPTISELSFFLPVGETLAILGASGSGKSTLASLLLRLREPTSGRILLDGVDHWEFAPEEFHHAVAFVDQDSFMFNKTIAENVAAGMPGMEREAILEALRKVRLDDVMERLPQGIDTVLAERGATLSGGQRQRLAIARAIVRDPQILVLDEPTSALDPETEEEVVRAIDAASVGRTTIIITHRAATALHATRRLQLQSEGRAEPAKQVGVVAAVPRD